MRHLLLLAGLLLLTARPAGAETLESLLHVAPMPPRTWNGAVTRLDPQFWTDREVMRFRAMLARRMDPGFRPEISPARAALEAQIKALSAALDQATLTAADAQQAVLDECPAEADGLSPVCVAKAMALRRFAVLTAIQQPDGYLDRMTRLWVEYRDWLAAELDAMGGRAGDALAEGGSAGDGPEQQALADLAGLADLAERATLKAAEATNALATP